MAGIGTAAGEQLLRDGTFSDFTITCKDRTFPVHRNILATASHYLKVILTRDFKEKLSGTLDVPEEEPEIVALALAFIYTNEYKTTEDWFKKNTFGHARAQPANAKKPSTDLGRSQRSVLTYQLADQWGLEAMKKAALQDFGQELISFGKTDNKIFEVARFTFENTEEGHGDLRALATNLCVEAHLTKEPNANKFRLLCEEHELVAFKLASAMGSACLYGHTSVAVANCIKNGGRPVGQGYG